MPLVIANVLCYNTDIPNDIYTNRKEEVYE